ncbi:cytochrome P450 [Streptomyces sp. NPDC048191]|uniref:cytochrome P450 n=1 Tax=Streptomyces sp. NPDC048191 TaxID=3155484 RepID=UPI0033EDE658
MFKRAVLIRKALRGGGSPVAGQSDPGPSGLPLLGNLPEFARDPLAFFSRLRDEHGDWVPWSLGPKPCLLISRPADVNELLAGIETSFSQAELGWAVHHLLGDGVVTSTGEDWRRKRSLVQAGVRPRQVRSYAKTMVDCADDVAATWRDGQCVEVHREMTRLTQRIAVRTLFGVETAGREEAIARAMAVAQQELGAELRGVTAFFPPWILTPGRRRLRTAVVGLDAEIHRIIAEHRAATAAGEEREDLLSRLLDARDVDGTPLSDREVRDEAVTLYVGSHETSATTLTWTWHLLSGSPQARTRLDAELAEVLEGRLPTFDDYARLPFTQALIKESLRLYPPFWALGAVAREGATISGRHVPASTTVWASQWSIHRDSRLFPEPDAFRPQRWDSGAPNPVPEHAWFPFGGGPRTCLGTRFALVELALTLATLAQRWRLDTGPGEVRPVAGLNLQPSRPISATVRSA